MDVRTRADQLKDLRELAKNVPSASLAEQERVSLELAQAIRSETDPIVRAQMMRTLGVCNTQVAAAMAAAGVKDSDARVRVAACEALGVRGGAEQVRVLGGVLSGDTDIDVRLAAARALGDSKDPAAVQALAAALEDSDPALQVRGMRSLEKVAHQDFGNDVAAWRQYVRGETPQPRTQSIAARFRQLW
jgi:HEAT repeat protein